MKSLSLLITLMFGIIPGYGQNRSDSEALKIANDLLPKMTLSEKVLILHEDHAFYTSDSPCSARPELTENGHYLHGQKAER